MTALVHVAAFLSAAWLVMGTSGTDQLAALVCAVAVTIALGDHWDSTQ